VNFIKPFQDSIKISLLEAENALIVKRNYESCSFLRIKDAETIEILRTQNKEILDSLQTEKIRNIELTNKLKDKDFLLKESEAKMKRKRGENWIWRLGFAAKILISLL